VLAGRSGSARADAIVGSTLPRLWTPPLRELTPATSVGFDQVEFARDVLHRPLDPWQEWLVVHAGELLPDGRPRFRVVLVLVARQNGKTELLVILSLYWQFVEGVPLILGTSTKLDYARESWTKATKLAERTPDLAGLRPRPRWKREANGEQESWALVDPDRPELGTSRYKIAASNEEGGRSLTVHRLILDELRQHHDYSAWDASEPATSAVMDAQIWALSNAGSDRSVVLNDLRESALKFIGTGDGDPRLGLFEWSAPEYADPTDLKALAQANPNLGRRLDPEPMVAAARRAVAKGGVALSGFKTEKLCIRVRMFDPAVDPTAWGNCRDTGGTLDELRDRVVCCVDVAPDSAHVTLMAAAALGDGRVRIECVTAWSSTEAARAELEDWLYRIGPRVVAWFPSGPAAVLAPLLRPAELREPDGEVVEVETPWEFRELKGTAVSEACQGFADLVLAGRVLHPDDELINDHVGGAQKYQQGDGWRFVRRGAGHVDAAYAAAGAVREALLLPVDMDYDVLSIPVVEGQCPDCDAWAPAGGRIIHYEDCALMLEGRVPADA